MSIFNLIEEIEIENDKQVVLKEEEILRFLSNGAQPTETVKSILTKAGIWAKFQETKKK